MSKKNILRNGFLGLIGLLLSSAVWAHGGAKGTDTDQCKFEIEPDHWIHYTAYQPMAFSGEEFCGNLPSLNTLTKLVFDYQDPRYRNMSVEFEVTKEPEGSRVFFMEAQKHKSGTVVLTLPKGISEQGKYLIHITLVPDEGDRMDVHMGFQAGFGESVGTGTLGLYALILLAALYVLYLSHEGFKQKVDAMLGKAKEI